MKVSQYWYGVAVGLFALFATAAFAESGKIKTPVKVLAPDESKVVGFLDLRPGYLPNGSMLTENTVRLGYQFKKDRQLVVEQYVNTNILTPNAPTTKGLNVTMYDGYVGARLNNLWEDKANGLSFSYSPRFYLPQSSLSQEAGLITFHRSNFQLKKTFNDSFSLSFVEIPLLFLYDSPGYKAATGPTANPIFQNRLYLIADINLTSKLTLSLPLMFFQTKNSNYDGASNSGAWTNSLFTWPELDYAIDEHATVGIAYYNNTSLIDTNFKAQIDKAIQNGVYQLVFIYNI